MLGQRQLDEDSMHARICVQAIDQLQFRDKVSSATGRMYDEVRGVFAPVVQDRVLQPDIQAVKELVLRSPIPSLTTNAA